MKEKWKISLQNLRGRLEKLKNKIGLKRDTAVKISSNKTKKDHVYPIKIPVAGVHKEDILVEPDDGFMIVQTERQIIVEEYNPYQSWKRYTSFGFGDRVLLPEGIKLNHIHANLTKDAIRIGWRKQA